MDPIISCNHLDFKYEPSLPNVLHDVHFSVRPGARVLVVGANGAGKTTLLRVIAGRHMVPRNSVMVMGKDAFHDTTLCGKITYLGERWTRSGDVSVRKLLEMENIKDPGQLARIELLFDVLDVDPEWRVYRLSDGQRRRVQILIALSAPVKLMLLDEITTDLDVVGRQALLQFLKEESEQRGVTVVYSTHIFDGIEPWATDIAYIRDGAMMLYKPMNEIQELVVARRNHEIAPLFTVVKAWLTEEKSQRAQGFHEKERIRTTLDGTVYREPDVQYNTGSSRSAGLPVPNMQTDD